MPATRLGEGPNPSRDNLLLNEDPCSELSEEDSYHRRLHDQDSQASDTQVGQLPPLVTNSRKHLYQLQGICTSVDGAFSVNALSKDQGRRQIITQAMSLDIFVIAICQRWRSIYCKLPFIFNWAGTE